MAGEKVSAVSRVVGVCSAAWGTAKLADECPPESEVHISLAFSGLAHLPLRTRGLRPFGRLWAAPLRRFAAFSCF